MYQECYVIALDEFKKSRYYLDNREALEVIGKDTQNAVDIENTDIEKTYVEQQNTRMDVNAWLSLFVTDKVEDIDRNILKHPWLEEIYKEMAEYLVKPEEVFIMYSEALRILDENTVKYMVDELQGENKELKEKTIKLESKATELENKTTELKEQIIDFKKKQLESDIKIIMNMKKKGFSIEEMADVTGKTEAEVKKIAQEEKVEN